MLTLNWIILKWNYSVRLIPRALDFNLVQKHSQGPSRENPRETTFPGTSQDHPGGNPWESIWSLNSNWVQDSRWNTSCVVVKYINGRCEFNHLVLTYLQNTLSTKNSNNICKQLRANSVLLYRHSESHLIFAVIRFDFYLITFSLHYMAS